MKKPNSMRTIAAMFTGLILGLPCCLAAEPSEARPVDPARRTATVRLIERTLPAVVSIRAFSPTGKPGEERINLGSGSVIHPAGFVLTNAHVVAGMTRGDATFNNGAMHALKIVVTMPHEDIALVKLDSKPDDKEPLPTLPLGRSDDLLLGEPVLSIGNPAGLVNTVSEGVVSGLKRSTTTEHTFLPTMIQTNAAISGGSSGGPLINVLGEQIGLITSRKADAENIAFAIAIDRVRETLAPMLSAEQRRGFLLGLGIDPLAGRARVAQVVADSPAAEMQPGDIVTSVGGLAVRHAIDYELALWERSPGETLTLDFERNGKPQSRQFTLKTLPLAKPAAETGLEPGLSFQVYQGVWTTLPKFADLQPSATGVAQQPSLPAVPAQPGGFGLVFTGLVKVPADGLYMFYTRSDDGSRLYLDDRLVVDNDGLHAARDGAGVVRLAAGLHSLTLAYFEASGDKLLELSYEGPGLTRQPIPSGAFFHRAKAAAAPATAGAKR